MKALKGRGVYELGVFIMPLQISLAFSKFIVVVQGICRDN